MMTGTDRESPTKRLIDRETWTTRFLATLEQAREEAGRTSEKVAGEASGNATGEASGNATGEASGNATGEAISAGSKIDTGGLSLPGSILHFLKSTPSTNVILRSIAERGGAPGTIVLADEQTAGRGRHGRSWFSPPGGGRYCSILLEPGIAPDRVGWITLAAALALVRSARPLGAALTIKWPNDLECEGRKVAGVLAEMVSRQEVIGGIILGTGVNVDWSGCEVPDEVRERGGTLSECAGREVDGNRFMADYL
ncbi:biotin--[acetyl-CoA-carboxylase] ligase, partial [Gemmatimonadota bacterium]